MAFFRSSKRGPSHLTFIFLKCSQWPVLSSFAVPLAAAALPVACFFPTLTISLILWLAPCASAVPKSLFLPPALCFSVSAILCCEARENRGCLPRELHEGTLEVRYNTRAAGCVESDVDSLSGSKGWVKCVCSLELISPRLFSRNKQI